MAKEDLVPVLLALAIIVGLAFILPWVVIKVIICSLLVIWLLTTVGFLALWAYYHYKEGGVAKSD